MIGLAGAAALSPLPAHATLPGSNGRVVDTWCRNGANQHCYVRVSNLSAVGNQILTKGPVLDVAHGWSPDGRRILFSRTSIKDGIDYKGIFTIDQNGENRRKVTGDLAGTPVFSPDGAARIAVATSRGVYVMRRDGSRRRRIYNAGPDPALMKTEIAWTTSGRIAFMTYRDYNACDASIRTDIWTIRPDGSGLSRVTDNKVDETSLDASPDGKRLLYQSARPCSGDRTTHLYSIKLDGTGERRVTRGAPFEGPGVYSPDGRFILGYGRSAPQIMTTGGRVVREVKMFGAWQPVHGSRRGPVRVSLHGRVTYGDRIIRYMEVKGRIPTKIRGIAVTVTLYQLRSGRWRKLDGDGAGSDRRGRFSALVYDRPPRGTCKVKVEVGRTTEHRPTVASRQFPCRRPG